MNEELEGFFIASSGFDLVLSMCVHDSLDPAYN